MKVKEKEKENDGPPLASPDCPKGVGPGVNVFCVFACLSDSWLTAELCAACSEVAKASVFCSTSCTATCSACSALVVLTCDACSQNHADKQNNKNDL